MGENERPQELAAPGNVMQVKMRVLADKHR